MINTNITIAIDGTAASGKGTLARSLAKEFKFAYLDTGKLYRASALIISKENIHFENINDVITVIKNFDFSKFNFFDDSLKSDEIGKLASMISCLLYTSPSPRDQRGSGMAASA